MIHNVKSAIIFAAGRGSRMNKYSVTPKALLPVHGVPLIERMIEQMYDAGIEEIVIVTGYKHDMFDYLNEKYAVTLAYNKKWFCTNSISSFMVGYNALSSFAKRRAVATTRCDLYFTTNVFEKKIEHSGYLLEFSTDKIRCMKEWLAIVEDTATQRIAKVLHFNSSSFGYILKGLAYWTPVDFAKIAKFTKSYLDDGKHFQNYYDDIPCFLNASDFALYAFITEQGNVIEVDDETDYLEITERLEVNNEQY